MKEQGLTTPTDRPPLRLDHDIWLRKSVENGLNACKTSGRLFSITGHAARCGVSEPDTKAVVASILSDKGHTPRWANIDTQNVSADASPHTIEHIDRHFSLPHLYTLSVEAQPGSVIKEARIVEIDHIDNTQRNKVDRHLCFRTDPVEADTLSSIQLTAESIFSDEVFKTVVLINVCR